MLIGFSMAAGKLNTMGPRYVFQMGLKNSSVSAACGGKLSLNREQKAAFTVSLLFLDPANPSFRSDEGDDTVSTKGLGVQFSGTVYRRTWLIFTI